VEQSITYYSDKLYKIPVLIAYVASAVPTVVKA
jgi:hypothetical protein